MKAKEMFEELGYKKIKGIMSYEKFENGDRVVIDFHSHERFYTHIRILKMSCQRMYISARTNLDLHKAIHQQLKELGWLDE